MPTVVLPAYDYHLEAVVCGLLVLYVFGGETAGGMLGNLDGRKCNFQEKLNPIATFR